LKGGGKLLWLESSATVTVIQNMAVHQNFQFLRVWNTIGDAGNAALEMAALHLSMFMHLAYCYKNISIFLRGCETFGSSHTCTRMCTHLYIYVMA